MTRMKLISMQINLIQPKHCDDIELKSFRIAWENINFIRCHIKYL
jgi:hypothetical protein